MAYREGEYPRPTSGASAASVTLDVRHKDHARIPVANPQPGHQPSLPLRQAQRHVRRGAAQIIAGRVVFIPMAIARAIRIDRRLPDPTIPGYLYAAATGIASLRAIAGLPMARPSLALNCGQRSQGCGPLYCGDIPRCC